MFMLRGVLVNAGNPKAVVCMLAVLPQFLDPAAPLLPQYLIIAATMCAVDVIVMTGYTGLAARVLTLMRSPKQQRTTNRAFAGLFFGAAGFLSSIGRAAAWAVPRLERSQARNSVDDGRAETSRAGTGGYGHGSDRWRPDH